MRLFLNLNAGVQRLPDKNGADFADLESAQDAAVRKARALMVERLAQSRPITPGWFIEIADEQGQAVKIVPMQSILAGSSVPERYYGLYRAAPQPYLLLTPSLFIMEANPAYGQATMTDLDGIRGRPMFEVFPDNPDDPSADGVQNLTASLDRVLAHRQADTMRRQRYDIRARNGEWLERHWQPMNFPVFDEGGEVAFVVHSVQDVTAAVRRQAA
jgi:PAS domain-containing protein